MNLSCADRPALLLRRLAALVCLAFATFPATALEVAGMQVAEKVERSPQALRLNGAGVRRKLFIKVYVGALYVPQTANQPQALGDGREWLMELRMLRGLDGETLVQAVRDGFDGNLDAAQRLALGGAIAQFEGILRRIGSVKTGDLVAVDHRGGIVAVSLNGEPLGRTEESRAFARALLDVWIGTHPVDESLKKALLGG